MNTSVEQKNAEQFWKEIYGDLSVLENFQQYKSILAKVVAKNLTDTTLELACDNPFFKATLLKNMKEIKKAAERIGKKPFEINITVEKTSSLKKLSDVIDSKEPMNVKVGAENKQQSAKTATPEMPLFQAPENAAVVLREKQRKSGLNPKYTFENYLAGENNQLAFAIAQTVSKTPGEVYNPVFIYSGVGLGKTHLLQAIGNKILQDKPGTKVIYTTGETFTNELIESLQNKGKGKYTSNEFRNKFRKADVFLIDDVQFIIGKTTTQEEFFHTFNTLYMDQRQIVITSDRPPKEFDKIAERITSRFKSGIVVDIQAPGFEMRSAILRKKRDLNKDPLTDEVINYIADKIDTNVRELEGAYLRVLTKALTYSGNLTKTEAAEALKSSVKETSSKNINVNQILKTVCMYYSVKMSDIKGDRRTKDLVIPRQVAMYLMKEITETPYMAIGDFLGGRDHTTILYGVEKIKAELEVRGKISNDISQVKDMLEKE